MISKEVFLRFFSPLQYYYLFIFFLPFTYRFIFFESSINTTYFFAFFCFILFIIDSFHSQKQIFDNPLWFYFGLWIIVLAISVIQSRYIAPDVYILYFSPFHYPYIKSYLRVLQLCFFIFFSFSIASMLNTEQKLLRALILLVYGSIIHAIITLIALVSYLFSWTWGIYFLSLNPLRITRIQGLFPEPGYLAAFTLIVLPLCIFLYNLKKEKKYLVCTAINAVVFFLTFSRAAFIGAFIGLCCTAIIYLFHRKFPRKYYWYGGAICMSIFLILAIYVYETNRDKDVFISTQTRLIVYTYAFDAFSQHPWLGIGFSNFSYYTNLMFLQGFSFRPTQWFPEINNLILQMFTETGIIGMFVFCLLLYHLSLHTSQLSRTSFLTRLRYTFYFTGAGLFVFSLFFSVFALPWIWVWMGFLLSAVALNVATVQ